MVKLLQKVVLVSNEHHCIKCNVIITEKNTFQSYIKHGIYKCRDCAYKEHKKYMDDNIEEYREKNNRKMRKYYQRHKMEISKNRCEKRKKDKDDIFSLSDEEFLNKYVRGE